MATFEVGQEIFQFDDPEREKQWRDGIKKTKEEIASLPEGEKHITFYMTDSYMRNFSPNTKIPYKKTITKIRLKDGVPVLKSHYISVRQGRVKTSNAEEISFLDMKQGFVRARDRKLTPREMNGARIKELEDKVKELMSGSEEERKEIETVEESKEEIDTKVVEVKRKPGRPKKSLVESKK